MTIEPFAMSRAQTTPSDAAERRRALDPKRSFLVQAPAGSGKTYLLTQRFLRLLGEAESPDEIVAITFTNAAAAEMQQRILAELEKAESQAVSDDVDEDPNSLKTLARRALDHAQRQGWKILDQPGLLRIMTIDSFCRALALQCPLSWGSLSGLGGKLEPVINPKDLYRRAATRTIEHLKGADSTGRRAVEALLLWRDNNWSDVEELIVQMLGARNRWYQDFVLARDVDWSTLRRRLEAPLQNAARARLERLVYLLNRNPGSVDFILELARAACVDPGMNSPLSLAERAELPVIFVAAENEDVATILEEAHAAHCDLALFLLTGDGDWRKPGGLNVHHGFPRGQQGKAMKARFGDLVDSLAQEDGLLVALAAFRKPIPVRYSEEEWELIRHCFTVLRVAAAELHIVFAESGSVDFTEVAQIALRVLAPEGGFPSDFAMRQADGIRHLLVDEFQDTSRNQHQLLARLIGAWPDRDGRSCFCVGDPMQSIYGFREADVELFDRVKMRGLETSESGSFAEAFKFDFVGLRENFRTAPTLVNDLNHHFERIFSLDEDVQQGGVRFATAQPARPLRDDGPTHRAELHLAFTLSGRSDGGVDFAECNAERTSQDQVQAIVALVQSKLASKDWPEEGKRRIAILARAKKPLVLIADAMRKAGVGFRAIDLVPLRERPEVLDVLSLTRALLNPVDRTAWLGVLRAPWCGLSLEELHALTSDDDAEVLATPIPVLLQDRARSLLDQGRLPLRAFKAATRVGNVLSDAIETRASAANFALGTWLQSVWIALGGDDTVDREQRQNLHLLWGALDQLPGGEADMMGPALHAALDALFALPDPAASSDFGVQLMTIHKAKGLEFEVVIVPDLEAGGKTSDRGMISWLERGLDSQDADATGTGQITEFLIAPIQAKGEKSEGVKQWVEGVKKERERQELKRLLYVAATRAREELHFFARPRFCLKDAEAGRMRPVLNKPNGLLATAWPAFGTRVETQFEEWLSGVKRAPENAIRGAQPTLEEEGGLVQTLAASEGRSSHLGLLFEMPSISRAAPKATRLRRLPESYVGPEWLHHDPLDSRAAGIELLPEVRKAEAADAMSAGEESSRVRLYPRNEGELRSRLEGIAIHTLLERLSLLRQSMDTDAATLALGDALPAIVATMRGSGMPTQTATKLSKEALETARLCASDLIGAWILAPHAQGDTETRWSGLVDGKLIALRPDRVFFSPPPDSLRHDVDGRDGVLLEQPCWWIIDYKNSRAEGLDVGGSEDKGSFLESHRRLHAPQLELYARVLRSMIVSVRDNGLSPASEVPTAPIRLGLFYPRLRLFDYWEV